MADTIKGDGNEPSGPCKDGSKRHDWKLGSSKVTASGIKRFYQCRKGDAAFITTEKTKGR